MFNIYETKPFKKFKPLNPINLFMGFRTSKVRFIIPLNASHFSDPIECQGLQVAFLYLTYLYPVVHSRIMNQLTSSIRMLAPRPLIGIILCFAFAIYIYPFTLSPSLSPPTSYFLEFCVSLYLSYF